MAMATSTQLSSSLFHSQITKKPFLLPATISVHGFSTRRLKSLSLSHRSSVSASAASSTVDVTEQKKSTKTLPFRVGHGFDLHRLEPGYPLIIGGIDIPHDRGCEAHSDGKSFDLLNRALSFVGDVGWFCVQGMCCFIV